MCKSFKILMVSLMVGLTVMLKKKYLEVVILLLALSVLGKHPMNLAFYYGCSLDKLGFIFVYLLFWMFVVLFLIKNKYNEFFLFSYTFFLMGLFVSLLLCVGMENMFGFYIFFELSLIPLFLIIIGWGYQSERIQAAFYLFMYTIVGSLPMLFIFSVVYFVNGLNWLIFVYSLDYNSSTFYTCLSMIILVGFFIKLPMYSVHLWLPKAHVEAPVAGSMVLAAVLLKFSFYGVFRILFFFKTLNMVIFMSLLLWGGILSSLLALRQSDMKSLVAYSSIGHMASMMGSCLLMFYSSLWGAVSMLIAHGFCSSALFFIINSIYEQNKSRQAVLFSGQVFIFFLGVWWALFLCMNFATPPFMGLIGEILIVSLMGSVSFYFMIMIISSSFVAAVFSLYLFSAVVHGKISKSFSTVVSYDFFNTVCLFHILPAVLLVLKMNMMSV